MTAPLLQPSSAADRRPLRQPSHDERLVAVACPDCHAALAADRDSAGTPGRCPLCRAAFVLPVPPRRLAPASSAPADRNDDDPLRRMREERSTRRARRNLVMLVSGVVILLAIVLLFGTRRPKKRRAS